MSYAEGFNSGTAAGRAAVASWEARAEKERQKVLDQQRAELHDMQMQGLRRQRGLEREQDDAFGAHMDLANNGYVQAEGTGLSQPSAQFVASGNAGLGTGAQAVQDTASMYQREMSRFAGAADPPAQGLPKYDGTAPVSRRGATDVELEQSLGRVSAAQRDARGMRESTTKVKELKLKDEDAAFMKQAMADLRDPAGFIEKYGAGMNKNGDVDGFVTFDPKTKQFVVASKSGVESMDEVDMLAHVVAVRELGRGNVQAGLELMAKSSDRKDAKLDKKWGRAMELAKSNMELYFGGIGAENDTTRTNAFARNAATAERRARAAQPREVPKEITDRMMAIELESRSPNTTPEKRAKLREEFDMLRVRATYALGRTTNLGRSEVLDQKTIIELATQLSKDTGKSLAESADAVLAALGQDPTQAMADGLKEEEERRKAQGGGGQGLRPRPESRIPPSPGQQRAQQQGLAREAREQERAMEQDEAATAWDRVAREVDLGSLDPASARELLTRFGAVMSLRERMDINRRAN